MNVVGEVVEPGVELTLQLGAIDLVKFLGSPGGIKLKKIIPNKRLNLCWVLIPGDIGFDHLKQASLVITYFKTAGLLCRTLAKALQLPQAPLRF